MNKIIKLSFAFIFVFVCCSCEDKEAKVINIIIKYHRFDPSIVNVKSGEKLKIIVHNQDNTVEEFESKDFNREKLVPSGGSVSLYVGPLRPGKYNFFGDFHPETAQGYLIVEEENNYDNNSGNNF
jgi:plastocyanin